MRRDVRKELMAATIGLSLANGFDETTVDEIATAAGVARRTFFRHFRVKEDAVFPDHDDCLARVTEMLGAASPLAAPLKVITEAAGLVLAMYAEDAETAVKRYELTRQVRALREREIATTSRYQRAFTAYLNARGGDRLRNEVIAASVVAAHNHVLRGWLRAGGRGEAGERLAEAFATLAPWLDGRAEPATDDVVVVVTRRNTPLWRIAEQIAAATDTQ